MNIWQALLPFILLIIFFSGTVLVMTTATVRRIYPNTFDSIDDFRRNYLAHWRGDSGDMLVGGLILGGGSFIGTVLAVNVLIAAPVFVLSTIVAIFSVYGMYRWLKASDDIDE